MKSKKGMPNIIFILTDDQGAWAMHCAGNEEIQTPNLDYLAEHGTRFTDFSVLPLSVRPRGLRF